LAAGTEKDGNVNTIEVDVKHKEVAEENIINPGLSDRVQVLLGKGLDVLPAFVKRATRKP
jgi:predicted O-methyltransferase YrrM